MNKVGIILSKPRSLTSLIDLVTKTITDQTNLYNLRLARKTSDNRGVELLAQSYRFNENIVEKLKLTSFGKMQFEQSIIPDHEELLYVLDRFGGTSFSIEYETRTATSGIQKIPVPDNVPPSSSLKCLRQYVTFFEHMLDLQGKHTDMMSTSFNAEGRRTRASFGVNKEGLWQLELQENWPKGPFARHRMSKLNKYFKRYLEPKVLYPVWNVRW